MTARLPQNAEIAAQFDLLADLIELEGGDGFRISAYRKAAARIRETGTPVARLALEGKATALSGIGKTIEAKIVEIVEDGEIHTLTKKRALVPPDVVSFMRLPGVGAKIAARIWHELDVTTLAGLKEAAEAERLRGLSGMGPKLEERILKALAAEAQAPKDSRALLGSVLPRVEELVEELRALAGVERVSEAGSVRRRRETLKDVDLIATAHEPKLLTEAFASMAWVVEVVARGDTKATVVAPDGLKYDLRVVPPECYGNLLQHFTGSKAHNVALREEAVRRGLSISEYGVTRVETGEVFTSEDEDEVYRFLGYDPIPPELRENGGELAVARNGGLPRLIEPSDIRGDLHTHSTWSDGKASIEEMAHAALARGYAYFCVTDHAARLREGRLDAQWAEIAALNEQFPRLQILRGCETSIRADGSLELPDEQLAQLDWVVASLHSSFDKTPTERIMAAMDNPHVDAIGHPTARKIGGRQPEVAIERIVEKAIETGTALELNGQPDRLDLRDSHARLAGEAGAKILISSDAHRPSTLEYLDLALAQARRSWLTKEHVLNTRPWRQIERAKKI